MHAGGTGIGPRWPKLEEDDTMTDPIARPGDDDPGIEHATEQVAETWRDAAPGKTPDADAEDFARMRRGFGEAADQATDTGGKDPSAA
jgi:hypothetical protein